MVTKKIIQIRLIMMKYNIGPRVKSLQVMRIVLLLLMLANMVFIFANSAATASASSALSGSIILKIIKLFMPGNASEYEYIAAAEDLHGILRECAHAAEFFPLGLLCAGFLLTYKKTGYLKTFAITAAFCGFYGLSDEVHQLFVKGRSFQISDIMADTGGAIIGAAFIFAIFALLKKRKERIKNDI